MIMNKDSRASNFFVFQDYQNSHELKIQSLFFFFFFFIFLCAKVVFMFHGIMRELENEIRNIEVHF